MELNKYRDADPTREMLPLALWNVDRLMHGGLSFGKLHVITGDSCSGKSTFCERIILNAITRNYRCFYHSDEKDIPIIKEDLIRMAVRPGMTVRKTNAYGCDYDAVPDVLADRIRSWLGEQRIWCYNSYSNKDIFEEIKLSILKYGTRVVVIDSLLHIQYRRNEIEILDNIVKLIDIARDYHVCIVLVDYKREEFERVSLDDQDWTDMFKESCIAELAHTVISYDMVTDDDIKKYNKKIIMKLQYNLGYSLYDAECAAKELLSKKRPDRMIRLLKNRNGGARSIDGFFAYYNEETNRIYSNENELNIRYGWEFQ